MAVAMPRFSAESAGNSQGRALAKATAKASRVWYPGALYGDGVPASSWAEARESQVASPSSGSNPKSKGSDKSRPCGEKPWKEGKWLQP